MSIRDTVDRAEANESDEPDADSGEKDVLPLELVVRENGSMTEFSAPIEESVNDSTLWVATDSKHVVDLEEVR